MERVTLNLARQFVQREWRVQCVFPKAGDFSAFLAWAGAQDLGPHVEPELSPAMLHVTASHSRAAMFALARFVRASRPDVVNIHYGSNFLSIQDMAAIRIAGVSRAYATFHQVKPWSEVEPRKKRLTGFGGRWLARRCIAICEPGKRLLAEADVPASKVAVIYCGVRPQLAPGVNEAASLRRRLGIPASAFVVLVMASLLKGKGITDVITAMSRIPETSGGTHLIIAGDGPERAELEKQTSEHLPGRAHFLGHVSGTTAHIYAAANVFVLASYAEGLPLVYHEAALLGVPMIGTDVGGTSDAILDGRTGILIQPHDVDSMAAAIARVRDRPDFARTISLAARQRAQALFTDAAMADAYEAEFRR